MSLKDPVARAAYIKDWQRSNPDKVRAYRKKENERHKRLGTGRYDPDTKRRYGLQNRYGMTLEEYDAMYDALEGICPVCLRQFQRRGKNIETLCVDHNHTTGEVRGLLCCACNRGLGFFEDSPAALYRLTQYLDKEKSC